AYVAAADHRRFLDGREPRSLRRYRLGHAASPRHCARALSGRRSKDPRVSFGGLHTNHRAIVAAAAIVFFVLTLVMAVLPALREQALSSPVGVTPRSAEAERGRHVYMREGCGFCHTQFVRDLPMDRPHGRATL